MCARHTHANSPFGPGSRGDDASQRLLFAVNRFYDNASVLLGVDTSGGQGRPGTLTGGARGSSRPRSRELVVVRGKMGVKKNRPPTSNRRSTLRKNRKAAPKTSKKRSTGGRQEEKQQAVGGRGKKRARDEPQASLSPKNGDPILVVKEPWIGMLLGGDKTMGE